MESYGVHALLVHVLDIKCSSCKAHYFTELEEQILSTPKVVKAEMKMKEQMLSISILMDWRYIIFPFIWNNDLLPT